MNPKLEMLQTRIFLFMAEVLLRLLIASAGKKTEHKEEELGNELVVLRTQCNQIEERQKGLYA